MHGNNVKRMPSYFSLVYNSFAAISQTLYHQGYLCIRVSPPPLFKLLILNDVYFYFIARPRFGMSIENAANYLEAECQ